MANDFEKAVESLTNKSVNAGVSKPQGDVGHIMEGVTKPQGPNLAPATPSTLPPAPPEPPKK
jgi:hypothetical protein